MKFPLPEKYRWLTAVPFFMIHAALLGLFFVHFQWRWVALMFALYFARMFVVTAGYHRYFSHRSFKLNRFWQFMLAFGAESSGQKGVLWWAANHRHHHRYSDQEEDLHSPGLQGIWWAHVGWILSEDYTAYNPRMIQDFGKYPELRRIDKWHLVPPFTLAALIFALCGPAGFAWGFIGSTVLLYHGTFCINSLAHVWGSRRFNTKDQSRNNFVLALVTLGEGWHNNHHQYMHTCRQGIHWWEVDFTYYGLKALSWIGITKEIRELRLSHATPENEAEAA